MKRIRLDRCAVHFQPPRNPRLPLHQHTPYSTTASSVSRKDLHDRRWRPQSQWHCQRRHAASKRKASSAAVAPHVEELVNKPLPTFVQRDDAKGTATRSLNFPSHHRALQSAKLAALHARLSLPAKLPLQTLARCLVDFTVDPRPAYSNAPLALVGQDLLGYYTTEWLLCHYPRLPMPVLDAAQYGYAGNKTLDALRSEWGVEVVAAPGPEVDPGLLQLKRGTPGNAMAEGEQMQIKNMPTLRRLGTEASRERLGIPRSNSAWGIQNHQLGDEDTMANQAPFPGAPVASSADDTLSPLEGVESSRSWSVSSSSQQQPSTPPLPPASQNTTSVENASASFVRALAGALYLHAGASSVKAFHKDHILSRHLPLHTLFNFTHPTRDLSRLCAREGFEPPVARLISETGRLSRSPVFVVGVFSGNDKLGEAAGSSLNEGRVRAAAAALRAWYLYSPPRDEIILPSQMERSSIDAGTVKKWKSQMIDIGEIVT